MTGITPNENIALNKIILEQGNENFVCQLQESNYGTHMRTD